jgi:hypothetical protein
MRDGLTPFRLAACALWLWVCAGACLDVEPVQKRSGVLHAGPLSSPDAATPDAGRCAACVEQQGSPDNACEAELSACIEHPRCGPLFSCLLAAGCFDVHGDEARNECAIPCALSSGVTSAVEVSVQLLVQLGECSLRHCPDVCY